MIPGKLEEVPFGVYGVQCTLKLACGACKVQFFPPGVFYRGDAIAHAEWLNRGGYRHFDRLGWCCPACSVFVQSVHGEEEAG